MFTMTFLLITLLLFVLGTAVGSFLNVMIFRSLAGDQWVKGRSRCDHCRKPLAWFDLIPLFSYAFLLGKSRCCHQPLSISHPVIEFLTGSLFVWWYWGGSLFFQLTQAPYQVIQPLFWLSIGILLLIIFFTDVRYMIIPDTAVIILFGLSAVYRLALTLSGLMQFEDLVKTVLAAVVAVMLFFGLWFGTKGKGMGFGDVKLVGPLVLLLGWSKGLVGLFLAFVIGAVVGMALLMAGRHKLKQPIPFGPFLVIGAVIGLLIGDQLMGWYVGML